MVYREHGSGMWPDAHTTNLFTGVNIYIINMLRANEFPEKKSLLTDQHVCYCILNRTILIRDFIHFNCGFIYVLEGSKNNSKQTVRTKLFSDFVPA